MVGDLAICLFHLFRQITFNSYLGLVVTEGTKIFFFVFIISASSFLYFIFCELNIFKLLNNFILYLVYNHKVEFPKKNQLLNRCVGTGIWIFSIGEKNQLFFIWIFSISQSLKMCWNRNLLVLLILTWRINCVDICHCLQVSAVLFFHLWNA